MQNPDLGTDTHTPGLTTRPDADELQPRAPILSCAPGPRSLRGTSLSVDSINDLYQQYVKSLILFTSRINLMSSGF